MKSSMKLDHTIINVNDVDEAILFWSTFLGFKYEGTSGPFSVMRLSSDLIFLFAPRGTEGCTNANVGGSHFAFSLNKSDFECVFNLLKEHNVRYGDSFKTIGSQQGPGEEFGARGLGKALYFNDPNNYILEIRISDAD